MLFRSVGEIRSAGRSTQGVKLINLEPGDQIASIERLSREEDVDETGVVPTGAAAATSDLDEEATVVDSEIEEPGN